MLEEEAKKKWCPHMRLISKAHQGFNAIADTESETCVTIGHCVGSDCMMWVQDFDATNDGECGIIKR